MNHENEITPYKSNQKELQMLIPNQFNVEGWKLKKNFKNSKKKIAWINHDKHFELTHGSSE